SVVRCRLTDRLPRPAWYRLSRYVRKPSVSGSSEVATCSINRSKSEEYASREFSDSPFSIRQKLRYAVTSPRNPAESAMSASRIAPMIQYHPKCLKHTCRKRGWIGRLHDEKSSHSALRPGTPGRIRKPCFISASWRCGVDLRDGRCQHRSLHRDSAGRLRSRF